MIAATASIQKAPQEWKWPLDLRTYDKAAFFPRQSYARSGSCSSTSGADVTKTNVWIPRLERIARPILDAQERFPSCGEHRSSILRIVLTEMLQRRSSCWSWSPRNCMMIFCVSRQRIRRAL